MVKMREVIKKGGSPVSLTLSPLLSVGNLGYMSLTLIVSTMTAELARFKLIVLLLMQVTHLVLPLLGTENMCYVNFVLQK